MSETAVEKGTTILEVGNMSKNFGATRALKNVDMTVYRGEIRGLIGENGSGKSTVSSIIAGMQKATSGDMVFNGEPWNPSSMLYALEHGIGMVVQESGTIPGITVAENLFLGETGKFRCFKLKNGKCFGFVNAKEMNAEADKIMRAIGVDHIHGKMPCSAVNFQDRKLIEIAKVIAKNPEIFIVDETTTALSQQGRDVIYKLMRRLRDEGKAVLFISHDLEELMEVCDTLTVLRDGDIIINLKKEEFDADAIKQYMVGRKLEGDYYRSDYDPSCGEEVVLSTEHLSFGDVNDVTFDLHKGEILGIGGLSHCGMHTLGKLLFGSIKPRDGKFTVKGKTIKNESAAMKLGMGYVSKDRDVESLNLNAPIKDNIAVAGLDKFAIKNFLVWYGKENEYVDKQIDELSIKCFDKNQLVSALSGGNKQKVVFGKWVGRGSDILILDCPTRGVDIGVKQFMYQLMYKMKQEGKSIILISEELAELIGMSDRLMIMKDGSIAKEFTRNSDLTDSEVINYMI